MNKLVYLFELDSVRNSDDQMEEAMKALFREIVMNGNIVVITYNQLIDSRFFLSLLNDEHWSDTIIKLFQAGAIRISQFGSFRTPSQYLISQGLNSNEDYIFSGLPIKSSQKSLIALTKRSLMYSDLTELNEYISRKRSDEDLKLLFRELKKESGGDGFEIADSELVFKEMMNTLKDLKAVLMLILEFSNIQNAYNPPKDRSSSRSVDLYAYWERVKQINAADIPYWNDAVRLLNNCFGKVEHRNKRSEIIKRLMCDYKASTEENAFEKYSLAQAIVDICYNYTCEQSISNVSKHYNIGEFYDCSGYKTFDADFLLRLKQYHGRKKNRYKHFLVEESNDFEPYRFKRWWFCNLKRAAHLVDYSNIYSKFKVGETVYPYEYKRHSQRLINRLKLLCGVGKKILLTLVFLIIAYILENIIYESIESFFNNVIEVNLFKDRQSLILIVLASILSAAIVEFLSGFVSKAIKKAGDYTRDHSALSKGIDLPTFGESLEHFISRIGDLICALISFGVPYCNGVNAAMLKTTAVENTSLIDYVSPNVNEYRKFRDKYLKKNKGNDSARMFDESDVYPILDIDEAGADVRLTRIEEMTGKSYGLIYRSLYHTLLVDPILKTKAAGSDNDIFPYERLNNSSSKAEKLAGIVIVPVIREGSDIYLILIKQYRHALRDYQVNFPRGFNEYSDSEDKIIKSELFGEIKANPIEGSVVHLGSVYPDSGILSGLVSFVKVDIPDYKLETNKEGIVEILKLRPEKVEEMIKDGTINDGFTISAYHLWKGLE